MKKRKEGEENPLTPRERLIIGGETLHDDHRGGRELNGNNRSGREGCLKSRRGVETEQR